MGMSTFSGPVKSDNGFIGPAAYTNATAASTLTADDSGKTILLNSTTEFATTLPAPAAGLKFEFIVVSAPVGASYTVVTNASANIIVGKQFTAAATAGSNTTASDVIVFEAGQSVAGDRVELISDGTKWYAYAFSATTAGVSFSTIS